MARVKKHARRRLFAFLTDRVEPSISLPLELPHPPRLADPFLADKRFDRRKKNLPRDMKEMIGRVGATCSAKL